MQQSNFQIKKPKDAFSSNGIARNGHLQSSKTLLTKFFRKNHWFCFLARQRGKCQVIADVDSCDLEARPFNYTEVEKKTELVSGVFGEGERAASKKPALREGFAAQGWSFGVFGCSFG